LIMGLRNPKAFFYGVEIQPDLAAMARQNARINDFSHRYTVLLKDMRSIRGNDFDFFPDLVVCNPPYRKVCSGRINPDKERAVARRRDNL